MKTIISSFLLAFHNIRSHFFHTLLSVLGIVIGVAALVSILSLIDGMEEFARKEITNTTPLNSITITTNAYVKRNGVRVRKDTISILNFEDCKQLKATLTKPCKIDYVAMFNDEAVAGTKKIGAVFFALGAAPHVNFPAVAGTLFSEKEIEGRDSVVSVNLQFLEVMDSTLTPANALNKMITVRGRHLKITSVFNDGNQPRIGFPLTLMTDAELHNDMPNVVVDATQIEDVNELESQIWKWVNNKYGKDSFNVWKNTARLEQAAKGFLLFRLIMGLIVGISVLVGGIGIMNVLLISITERTVEIGIRKAVGANRRDIILQFLAESVTVSVFGSAMGLVLGILGTMGIVPIVVALSKVPFAAHYTLNTMLIVGILAILLGIIFGTYPAIRASRLDPVEAIRHE